MNVVTLFKSNAEQFRLTGIGNAFKYCGHNFFFYQPPKPLYDVFDEVGKIDLFIGTTFDLTQAEVNCLNRHPETKVVLKAGNWGPSNNEIDSSKYPIVKVTEQEKRLFAERKQKTGRPDLILCHYHPNRLEETMSGWREIGIEPFALMNAADVLTYHKGKILPHLQSDISYVGGYWPYKAVNFDRTLKPLMYPVGQYNIKIWGNQGFYNTPQYNGLAPEHIVKDIYASAKICPNISEPHSIDFGFDVIERPFKILSSGGFCISDDVKSLYEDVFTDNEIPIYHSGEEFKQMIDHFINSDDRLTYMDKGYRKVMKSETYFHRVSSLLEKLGFMSQSADMLDKYYNGFCVENNVPA